MSKPLNLGTVSVTHPLAGCVVTVRITRGAHVRLWLAIRLIELAMTISGGRVVITDDEAQR